MTKIKNEILLRKIALVIKELRRNHNLTQSDFFFDTGIHIARIESGKTNISISTLYEICNYFEISIKDFFTLIEK